MKKLAKRAAAMLCVVALVMSMMVVPASANSTGGYKTWDHGTQNFRIYTDAPNSNWRYYTMLVVRNTSKSNPIWIGNVVQLSKYTGGNLYKLPPQTSRVFYLTGAWKNYYIQVQVDLGSVEVSTMGRGDVYYA